MNRLKELRQAAGISQAELAERAGISLRVLQNYEQGRNDIGKAALQTAVALADALGVHAEELIRDPEPEPTAEEWQTQHEDWMQTMDNRSELEKWLNSLIDERLKDVVKDAE